MTRETDRDTEKAPDTERPGEVRIRFCRHSLVFGLVFGALAAGGSVGAAWFGTALAARAEITSALIARARCSEDVTGWTSIIFADGSQYTCTPRQMQPPTSREEAQARRRGGR